MALPETIEIVPLDKPVSAEITVPGSKSITNRALILAALADGETTLQGALWSEDTQVMVECLQELGFMVNVELDPNETCNRTVTVYGKGGTVPPGGTEEQPLELFVGNAGTAARFLTAFVCLGKGIYRIQGVPRMHERPQAALFQALRELGYRIDSPHEKLPAVIFGSGPRAGRCRVSIEESSQFASALLLCAGMGGWQVEVEGENAEEASYIKMTRDLKKEFSKTRGNFDIEADASSGSYFIAADRMAPFLEYKAYAAPLDVQVPTTQFSSIDVANSAHSTWQIDARFSTLLDRMLFRFDAAVLSVRPIRRSVSDQAEPVESLSPRRVVSRAKDVGDSIMTLIVLAPMATDAVHFTDLGRLRLQECERVVALRTELTKCGAKVIEEGDTLTVYPSELHGAEIETYSDHRMAMCFAILGLKVPGIKIKNPSCVKKTFPNFFQKLAAPPPHGLGATIRDGRTGRELGVNELFAE
jgi:3-phosphoshikimate 1-carboxyvinyltransferase